MTESDFRLMGVHAHPDDETITMGGLYALCADRGISTCNITCTDGKLATIFAPDMPEDTHRPRLAEIRQDEMREAARILGISEIHFLGYGDSGMAGADTNNASDAFWTASLQEIVGRLVEHIRRFKPDVVITYDANGGYGHPDHIQTHRATLLAVEAAYSALYPEAGPPWEVEKLYYTAFPVSSMKRAVEFAKAAGMDPPFGIENPDDMPFLTPDHLVTTTVDCRSTIMRKRQALRAHHSQIADDFPLLAIPDEVALQFADEHFQLLISRQSSPHDESDVFHAVRTANAVASF